MMFCIILFYFTCFVSIVSYSFEFLFINFIECDSEGRRRVVLIKMDTILNEIEVVCVTVFFLCEFLSKYFLFLLCGGVSSVNNF